MLHVMHFLFGTRRCASPALPNVLMSSPCSGHGFKFATAIGELQADLLTDGESRFDLSLFRLDRFVH